MCWCRTKLLKLSSSTLTCPRRPSRSCRCWELVERISVTTWTCTGWPRLVAVPRTVRVRVFYSYLLVCNTWEQLLLYFCLCFYFSVRNISASWLDRKWGPLSISFLTSFKNFSACSDCFIIRAHVRDHARSCVSFELAHCFYLFTARCTLVQSAVLRSHVVCLSVCLSVRLSVCDVGELWSHRLEFFENNFTVS